MIEVMTENASGGADLLSPLSRELGARSGSRGGSGMGLACVTTDYGAPRFYAKGGAGVTIPLIGQAAANQGQYQSPRRIDLRS